MNDQAYIMSFLDDDNNELVVIQDKYARRDDLVPNIGPEMGKALGFILRAINAKRSMEFGTCIGYSTIWLGEAMRATGGKLTAIEFNEAFYKEAVEHVEKAGLSEYVDLINGDAESVIDEMEGPFDFILQDSRKALYPKMLERSIRLIRVGGILAADDALFKPRGFEPEYSAPTHEYNEMVFSDPRLYSTILGMGDGLAISVKIQE